MFVMEKLNIVMDEICEGGKEEEARKGGRWEENKKGAKEEANDEGREGRQTSSFTHSRTP